ncbi:GRIP domain-containing protein [Xylaria cf. heliscus]|nr:GRIP domain-containing protein [Xylaria cf. heliscus]
MFSRLKDALDRTIAEEQARLRPFAEQRAASPSINVNDATTASPSTDPTKKPGQGASTHPDPAVFEAAFRPEDDADSASHAAASPKSSLSSLTMKGSVSDATTEKDSSAQGQDGDSNKTAGADASQTPELPPQVRLKLKRLEKLEINFQEVLRSYRIAHSQIKKFERALQENTPLSTIKDPAALMEYINQFTLKSDIASQEFRRISAEKDDLKKRTEMELAALKDEIDALKVATKTDVTDSLPNKAPADTAPKDGDEQENMFSYDDEILNLRTELASRTDQITKLELQIETFKEELAVAKEQGVSTGHDARKVEHQPNESGDHGGLALSKSDPWDAEISLLKETLENRQEQLRDNEASLEKERSRYASKAADAEKLSEENAQMAKQIASLTVQLEEYKTANAPREQSDLAPEATKGATPANNSSKKKNKKKKKGEALSTASETTNSETLESMNTSSLQADSAVEALRTKISTLEDQISMVRAQYADASAELEKRAYDINILHESLAANGGDVTEAKDKIKELVAELEEEREKSKKERQEREKLEKEREDRQATYAKFKARISELQELGAGHESTKRELGELKIRNHALQSDLGASQKVAQDRFKDLTNMKDLLAKAQTDMKSLLRDSADLKTTREELTSKQNELRALEKREKELKSEVSRVQRLSSDRESEVKLLNERLSAEKLSRAKLEDEKRVLGRDYRRLDAEKAEITTKAERNSHTLEMTQFELSGLRPKAKQLELDVARLQKEKTLAKEEVDLKTQQYQNAQGLLTSMRAENKELETQLKEAQNQIESLQEELAEAHKHLTERTRETETMRRRIKEENEKADTRVRDMRAQMEAAIEDRDRIEDETSTLGRRRAREAEELKTRVRELERESKALRAEKDALEASERQWRQRQEELEQIEEKATAETEDMRSTVSSLRSALDASEQQVRDAEKQKVNLRKLLDEAQGRYERTNKELKSVQSKLNLGGGSDATRNGGPSTGTVKGVADVKYVKTVFLQFLDAEDARVRLHLIPVILKLLGFDKNEEEKGAKTLQHLLGLTRK